jgi:hypothetical protein
MLSVAGCERTIVDGGSSSNETIVQIELLAFCRCFIKTCLLGYPAVAVDYVQPIDELTLFPNGHYKRKEEK